MNLRYAAQRKIMSMRHAAYSAELIMRYVT
jgi:hypothetical protein